MIKVKFEVLKIQGTKEHPAVRPYGLYTGSDSDMIWAGANGEATDEQEIPAKTDVAFPQLRQAQYRKGFVFYAPAQMVDDDQLTPCIEINGLRFKVSRSHIFNS